MITSVQQLLEDDEGRRIWPYTDTHGNLTWGIGHLMANGVTHEVETLLNQAVDLQFQADLSNAAEAMAFMPAFQGMDPVRQAVLIDMAFNLGLHGLLGFTTFLDLMSKHQWAQAAADLRGTKVYQQLPHRYERLAAMIETGQWPS